MALNHTEAQTLKSTFLALLDKSLAEQEYQAFLEQNTALIPREFLLNHGVHFDLVIRKMSLARDYMPDFFYMSKSSADWNLVLIEIEKPQSRYFKDGTNDLHINFLTALDQIARWRAWFDNSSNLDSFINATINQIRIPTSMRTNPCHIKYVLVHGRRAEAEGNDTRMGLIRARARDDFHIVSYDSLAESLHTKGHLYLGIRKNEYLEIISPHFVSESIFSWVAPSYLRITKPLREDIIRQRSTWRSYRPGGGLFLDHALPQIGECNVSQFNPAETVLVDPNPDILQLIPPAPAPGS
jgi:hypothetical protein